MNKKLKQTVRKVVGAKALENAKSIEANFGNLTKIESNTTIEGKLELIGIFGEGTRKKFAEFKLTQFE